MAQNIVLVILVILIVNCCAQDGESSLTDIINKIFQTDNQTSSPKPDATPATTQSTIFNPKPTKTTILNPQPVKNRSCGFQKECVPRFLCKNDTIVEDGTGIIDIRIDGVDCGYLEVCCDIPNKTTEPIIPVVPPEQHEGCGYQNPDGVGFRIIGDHDNEAQFGEFPWMVAIMSEEETAPGETLNLYECGGALIAPTIVLTAAHCIHTKEAKALTVRAGEWDTQTITEVLPHQDRNVKEIIEHEHYNKGSLFNDIAILIVDIPFVWQENVRPICLPELNANFDSARCYATGWGKDKFGRDGTYQVILKKIQLPVMPREQCQANLRNTRLGHYFKLHESFICAGGERGQDTCKGDGGSPLVCPVPGVRNRYYQAGIVAWGVGCGEEKVPGVYANVPHLRQWINDKLTAKGIDFRHFTP